MEEVQRLIQETLQKMGVSPEQMRELEEELRKHLGDLGLPGSGGPEPPAD
jgi:hypothetical protein